MLGNSKGKHGERIGVSRTTSRVRKVREIRHVFAIRNTGQPARACVRNERQRYMACFFFSLLLFFLVRRKKTRRDILLALENQEFHARTFISRGEKTDKNVTPCILQLPHIQLVQGVKCLLISTPAPTPPPTSPRKDTSLYTCVYLKTEYWTRGWRDILGSKKRRRCYRRDPRSTWHSWRWKAIHKSACSTAVISYCSRPAGVKYTE